MIQTIENEIQKLLLEIGQTDLVADQLLQKVEANPALFKPNILAEVIIFLFNGGFYSTAVSFIARYMDREDFEVPWAHLLEALGLSLDSSVLLDSELHDFLLLGVRDTNSDEIARKSQLATRLLPELKLTDVSNAERRRMYLQEQVDTKKKEMIEEIRSLRTQNLFEAEKNLIIRMQRMFPNDPEALKQVRTHQELHALEILSRKTPNYGGKSKSLEVIKSQIEREIIKIDERWAASERHQGSEEESNSRLTFSEESRKEMIENVYRGMMDHLLKEVTDQTVFDYVMGMIFLEAYDEASNLLSRAKDSPRKKWLRMDLLLVRRQFVDLLDELTRMEVEFSSDPETFFATAYLRAQAFWGLGQKGMAIEVMENLLLARPQYRTASTLLAQWRES